MSKRPTDHLEPSAKKRTNDRQLTKDDASDDGENEVDPGSFQRASEEVLKARRIVKTRRSAAAPASVAASANPFSGVSLGVPSVQSASASNPVNSVSDSVPRKASEEAEQALRGPSTSAAQAELPPAAGSHAAANPVAAPAADEATDAAADAAADAGAARDAEDGGQAPEVVATSAPTTFASFAASNAASPFGTLSAAGGSGAGFGGFGGANGSALGNGIAAFGALGSTTAAPGAFGFGSVTSAAAASSAAAPEGHFRFQPAGSAAGTAGGFSFATAPAASSFPSVASIFGSSGPAPAMSLFGGAAGSAGSRPAPAVALAPEEARVTGEEAERAAFSGDGVLYEFGKGQWRERGRGEMRVNVAPGGQARLVMRQRGNQRLVLNANLWPEMKVTLMDGGKGVTFACVNATKAAVEGAADKGDASKATEGSSSADAAPEPKQDGEPGAGGGPRADEAKLATFAFRVKERVRLDEFRDAVEANKAGSKAAEEKA